MPLKRFATDNDKARRGFCSVDGGGKPKKQNAVWGALVICPWQREGMLLKRVALSHCHKSTLSDRKMMKYNRLSLPLCSSFGRFCSFTLGIDFFSFSEKCFRPTSRHCISLQAQLSGWIQTFNTNTTNLRRFASYTKATATLIPFSFKTAF